MVEVANLMHATQILGSDELVLVRHAPVATSGHLYGRTDATAAVPHETELSTLRDMLSAAKNRFASPALRCQQTAKAIWGQDSSFTERPELWEQDFGDWEGKPVSELPDIGDLKDDALASFATPNGESFNDVCDRTESTLRYLATLGNGPTVAVVHAGVIRACLAIAIGNRPAALRFVVDCLSVTRFVAVSGDDLMIKSVNERF